MRVFIVKCRSIFVYDIVFERLREESVLFIWGVVSSCANQFLRLLLPPLSNLMSCFVYDRGLRHGRVNLKIHVQDPECCSRT